MFQFHEVFAGFVGDPIVDEPLVGFYTEIIPPIEIGDQKPTNAQGAASYVEQSMVLAQAGAGEKVEDHCRNKVVVLGRAYVGSIMVVARIEVERKSASWGFHGECSWERKAGKGSRERMGIDCLSFFWVVAHHSNRSVC